MRVYLARKAGGTRDLTGVLTQWSWSGDKSSISRQFTGALAYIEGSGLPVPDQGDLIILADEHQKYFEGIILRRELGSEDKVMSFTAFDYGFYLQRNDGTYKFAGASPEEITRLVCADSGVPVAEVPHTGLRLQRKFAGVPRGQIVLTAWTLAGEEAGKAYAVSYTPNGLRVIERTESTKKLVLRAGSNLMDATTVEDATRMVNRVAIYDENGSLLRRLGDQDAQALYGVMEQHVVQREDEITQANSTARQLLSDGALSRTVSVNVLGDVSMLTGETVVVQEKKTGLTGVFWIDADVHTWKNKSYYTRLTLNCRNVAATVTAGSEID